MNYKQAKIWGATQELFEKNNVGLHRIEVKKGGFCSRHYHKQKYNVFFVEGGKLKVTIVRQDAGKTIEDVTILSDGQMSLVRPFEVHFFEALEDTVAFEIYYCELRDDDIVRENVGGTVMHL